MDLDTVFNIVIFGGLAIAVLLVIRKAMRHGAAAHAAQEKQEALFKASFPELQPHFHPRRVLEFVNAWRARAAQPHFEWSNPPGFGVARARVAAPGPKGHPVELLDAAGNVVSAFLLQEHAEGGVIRIGPGKLTANLRDAAVRYWHPEREFKWSRLKGWRVITPISDRGIDTSDRGTSFSSDGPSSSSSSATIPAAAAATAVVAGVGGTFDGGGSSSSWDAEGASDSGGRTSY